MNALIIEAKADTPKIYFEPEIDLYLIEGRSLPENAVSFYQPVFDWAKDFFNSADNDKKFMLNIKLDYFNTASSKQIAKLLKIFSESKLGNNILIAWHYDDGDTCTLKAGKKYEKLINLKFEYIINEE